jgi:hypothetical protein
MVIETKFDVGDKVWGIEPGLQPNPWNLYRDGASLEIDYIRVVIHGLGQPSTCDYGLHAPGIAGSGGSLPEVSLFPNATEAQAECDRRNNEAAR